MFSPGRHSEGVLGIGMVVSDDGVREESKKLSIWRGLSGGERLTGTASKDTSRSISVNSSRFENSIES